MKDVAVGLQVRLDSNRLPKKALLPLGGKPVVEHVLEALREIPAGAHALLTDEESEAELSPIAEKLGFTMLLGPREDVLKRYALLAEETGAAILLRATGDNPLVSPRMAREAIALHRGSGAWSGTYQ